MTSYPLHLDLTGRRVLVVGAGSVASRRVPALLEAGAAVEVVAPEADAIVAELARNGRLVWHRRTYAPGDVEGAWLVHAATDVEDVNASVAEEARRQRIWAVRADRAEASDAHTPAVARRDGVVVSVTSRDPRRSVAIRDGIRSLLDDGSLSARPRRRSGSGSVVLIGGGPGAPDLITIQGRRELVAADVVVHDRLAPRALLEALDDDVEVIDAGKAPGRHELTQEQINDVLVDRAHRGLRVARLKGGDPFVFGRGSEEIQACVGAGVPVEVVPGVSSAIAGPAAAGIPVTHRGVSTGFIVLSGHVIDDLSAVAATGLTTVVLMGVATLPRLVEEFLVAGRPGSTPAAVVQQAFDAGQRQVLGTLADIEGKVAASGISNPAVIVIGDVVDVLAHLQAEAKAS